MAIEIFENKAKVSSVGASWPPVYDSRNDRSKGFYNKTISRREDALRMLNGIKGESSRTTIRAFMRKGLVEDIENCGFKVEAVIDAQNAIPGHDLVYLGQNRQDRACEPIIYQQEMESVREINSKVEPIDRFAAMQRVKAAGYTIEELRLPKNNEITELKNLYSEAYQEYIFELNESTVSGMFSNGNIGFVGRLEGRIVSALIAEHAKLVIDGKHQIDMYELSDYATLKKDRGQGLITLMQIEAIRNLREKKDGEKSIIYAEGRAPWIAVNVATRKAGMTYGGTLEKHCVIMAERNFEELGQFENLNVWFHGV